MPFTSIFLKANMFEANICKTEQLVSKCLVGWKGNNMKCIAVPLNPLRSVCKYILTCTYIATRLCSERVSHPPFLFISWSWTSCSLSQVPYYGYGNFKKRLMIIPKKNTVLQIMRYAGKILAAFKMTIYSQPRGSKTSEDLSPCSSMGCAKAVPTIFI